MTERITTKSRMYALLLEGRFGNIARAWESYEAIEASGYRGHVSLRSKEITNPVRLYHVPFENLATELARLLPSHKSTGLVFSESPPDHERVLQGELMRGVGGLFLTYSYEQHPMRIAFEKQRLDAAGLAAGLILRRHLDARDIDDLFGLLDDYPDHVVEFSSFRNPLGTLNRRTIIWEVRYY